MFFLDDEDRAQVAQRRGQHMRLGFALQLVTVRWLGTFLEDPLDVPGVVLEFMAEQLEVEDPSQVKRYAERRETPFDHQRDIRRAYGWKDFTDVDGEFAAWVTARSWTSGDGPKAIFTDGIGWLRERKVLLPGVTTLARLVAKIRDDTTKRLWGVLEGLLTGGQRSDIESLELAGLGAEALVPPRRLGELAKYGMRADASALRRHPDGRRLATLLATVRHLEGKSVDDTLELLDLLMATELVNKAQNASDKEKVRKHPKLAKSAARLAVAVEALFESDGWGGPDEEVRVAEVWEAIETVISRADLRAALVLVNESVPPADAADPDDWRAELLGRYTTVSGFLKVLPEVIEFGANAEGTPVLEAMKALPDVLTYRSRLPAPLIPGRLVDAGMVNSPWKRLVFGHPIREDGSVNRHAYAFCVLERFWRGLKRREIHADASTKWRNPQAELLEGAQWEAIRPDALTALSLPTDPDALLAEHSATLDAALREVGGRLTANPDVRVDGAGKIHLTGVKAIEEPPSLVDLRARTTAMLPRVELPEVILEVMSWVPELAEAFTAVSGGRSRLEDLPVSIAACLAAHSMNVGYRPIAKKGVPSLERSRLSHIYQNYFRPETLAPANAPLVARQAGLSLAQAWGGGLVAAVDGMRFVVPVPAAFARPNRKYFGSKRGMTWLNAMNDRGMGRGAKVVSGTIRDSLHMVDVIFGLDGGDLPEIVVSDTGSYSDLVFGLLELLGISYRPALADLPDQKGWRINASAEYGPLGAFARGKIDLRKIRRNWEDILRVVASIYTGTVRAYDVVTMLQRDGHPTALGEAIASYGRIFKTLHILQFIDVDESYRRDIKDIRNLQENRHSLARKICHGKKGELYHRYERGLENQLGALGLVLNCVTLWTTVYLDAAVRRLKAQGYPVREEDMARLSPFVHSHLGVHGTYTFALPELAPGAIRDLRDPDAAEDDDEI
ncbi:TnpA family transposase [Thermocatellispora tengchongensis]|uniref:TnpA family transposase n=1 Tax=Thermocatellispora tengchongensis TaxID=1073253 RepID=A0A840PDA1_9ACTN|nr:TnpA family transposase [Thermocatellispora tengchongensis]